MEESFVDPFVSAQVYDRLLITSWGHDPGVVPTSNVLTMLNDALTHSAVLIQVNTPTHIYKLQFYNEVVSGTCEHCVIYSSFVFNNNIFSTKSHCVDINCTVCMCVCV